MATEAKQLSRTTRASAPNKRVRARRVVRTVAAIGLLLIQVWLVWIAMHIARLEAPAPVAARLAERAPTVSPSAKCEPWVDFPQIVVQKRLARTA
jgi:hypothetical protein